MRLPEVAQEKLRASTVRVPGTSASARVCALYLAGAGVGKIETTIAIGDELRALNPDVTIDVDHDAASAGIDERLADLDPAAADVANGALEALRHMKRIFAGA